MDFLFRAELEKVKRAEAAKEERAGVIKTLLTDANKQAARVNVEATPVDEGVAVK